MSNDENPVPDPEMAKQTEAREDPEASVKTHLTEDPEMAISTQGA